MLKGCVLLLLTLSLVACHPNLTPVANVANDATQVLQTAGLILQAAQTAQATTNPLTGQPLISTAQLDRVALVCDKIGRIGTVLAQALTDYNAAKLAGTSTTALAVSIQMLVADGTAALKTVNVVVPSGTVNAIDTAVVTGLGLYAQIASLSL